MRGCWSWPRPLVCREQPATAWESTCFIHTSERHFSAQNINSEWFFSNEVLSNDSWETLLFPRNKCWELK